jgi:hypothetical protein
MKESGKTITFLIVFKTSTTLNFLYSQYSKFHHSSCGLDLAPYRHYIPSSLVSDRNLERYFVILQPLVQIIHRTAN